MSEYNFHISVKYGLTPQLCNTEWKATITATHFDEERLVESFREFIRHIIGGNYGTTRIKGEDGSTINRTGNKL